MTGESSKAARTRLRKQVKAALQATTDRNRTLRIIEASNIRSEEEDENEELATNKNNKKSNVASLVDKQKGKEKITTNANDSQTETDEENERFTIHKRKRRPREHVSSSSQSDSDENFEDSHIDKKNKKKAKNECDSSSSESESDEENEQNLQDKGKKNQKKAENECDSISSSESESDEENEQNLQDKGKKKVRGRTRLNILPVSERKRKKIKWNEYGQPVGKHSPRFSSVIGVLIRQYLPITINNWKKVDEELKERLWRLLLQKFKIRKWNKSFTLKLIGRLWRGYKGELSKKIKKVQNCPNIQKELALLKPFDLAAQEWDEFVKIRRSHKFKERSENMSKVRSQLKHPHTTGRMGFARLRRKLEKKGKVTRVQVWTEGHKRKDGKPINEAVEQKMKEIEEDSGSDDSEEMFPTDDALSRAIGPEAPGCVRGYGFGATLTKVGIAQQIKGWNKGIREELKALQAWKKEVEKDLASVHINSTALNVSNNHRKKDFASTSQAIHDTGLPKVPMENNSCKLFHWDGTGKIVAEATIASTDPSILVHHVLLGPDCYKVWVTKVIIPNVPLFRHSNEFSNLDDAKGSTIAWPHKYIDFS